MIHGTHTHSAPSMGAYMLDPDTPVELGPEHDFIRGASHSYSQFAADGAIEAAVRASERMQPGKMAVGAGRRTDLAYNRRMIVGPGKEALMPFPGHSRELNATFRHLEGPIDPEIGVAALRNDKLDSNGFFNNRSKAPRAPLRRNIFGGTLGGPVIKNKAFFFFDFEGTEQRTSGASTASVAPAAWRTPTRLPAAS